MEFIRGFHNLLPAHQGCVATLGNLDGFHLGHQALVAKTLEKSRQLHLPSTVITFEPLPREYFARQQHQPLPARLTRLRDKVAAIERSAVDRLLCLHFSQTLRQMTAEAFIEQILVSRLGVQHLMVGDDFRFGCDRKGDFGLLLTMGQRYGFEVESLATLEQDGQRVSSSRIRELLAMNQLGAAERLLGRRYSISGRVVAGNQLGRQWGVPTANIRIGHYQLALSGVYAVEVTGWEHPLQGVANLGVRPTVGGTKPVLEVFLFDFDQELYGQLLEVHFLQALRSEQKFASLDALKQQIHKDVEVAREYFDNRK